MLRTSSTHAYYNVRIQNGDPSGRDKICQYREQRTVPIVNNPSDYFMSCIRFQIPTSRIPLLVVPVQPFPNTDPTKTIYAVTLQSEFTSVQKFVTWVPHEALHHESTSPVTPVRPLSSQAPFSNAEDSYYYCRSYVHFMNLVNKAFADAFAELQLSGPVPLGAKAPYFTFDSQSSLFTLHAQSDFYDVNNSAGSLIKVFLNNDLFSLFGALDSTLFRNPVGEMDRQILITKAPDSSNIVSGYILFVQEYPTLVSWVGFTSLVITSGTIPIESEGIPTSLPFFSNNNVQLTGEPSFLNIIADYDALLTEGYKEFQTSMQYSPTAEYRLIDLVGTQPLTSFDIQVWWSDAFGGLHPLYIGPNECATLKFLFRKRSFNLRGEN